MNVSKRYICEQFILLKICSYWASIVRWHLLGLDVVRDALHLNLVQGCQHVAATTGFVGVWIWLFWHAIHSLARHGLFVFVTSFSLNATCQTTDRGHLGTDHLGTLQLGTGQLAACFWQRAWHLAWSTSWLHFFHWQCLEWNLSRSGQGLSVCDRLCVGILILETGALCQRKKHN